MERLRGLIGDPRRVDNFGDLLGPLIVDEIVGTPAPPPVADRRLLTVGSILHLARDSDVVWGTGRNGKIPRVQHRARRLDVRAVRGPLTRRFLEGMGVSVPAIYGDPALLLPSLRPDLFSQLRNSDQILLAPNMNDSWPQIPGTVRLDPKQPLPECLTLVSSSQIVIASSLHALILADALRIPAIPVLSEAEPRFKYMDYYLGTGRTHVRFASDPNEAMNLDLPDPLQYDSAPLLNSFPHDLWGAKS